MKIEYHYLPAPVTIEDFAEKHDLTMEVRQRHHQKQIDKFYAYFGNADIKGPAFLIRTSGNGMTLEQAIQDYASKISGKTLVVDAMSPNRREIQVPHLTVE